MSLLKSGLLGSAWGILWSSVRTGFWGLDLGLRKEQQIMWEVCLEDRQDSGDSALIPSELLLHNKNDSI